MTRACQISEITQDRFPSLYQFYQFFPDKYPFLLSSTSQATTVNVQDSSFDILFIEPESYLKLTEQLTLESNLPLYDELNSNDFLAIFNQWFQAEQKNSSIDSGVQTDDVTLPFKGGWFVFLAYELAQQIEPTLNLPLTTQYLPVAYAARVKKALVYEHRQDKFFFVTEPDMDHQLSLEELLNDSKQIFDRLVEEKSHSIRVKTPVEEKDEQFINSVSRIKQYIKDGDVFQVNLSRQWLSEYSHDNKKQTVNDLDYASTVAGLYKKLSAANPAPFSGLACFKTDTSVSAIISSSPERLLKIQNNVLESRPIAGTHPRGASVEEDERLISELHSHPKEQAEHIMLIDLIRNDLGRVCQPGSVRVDELMVNETYAHVHHIVSNVIGTLQSGKTPADAIRAMFPGGTITGCPKIRCMEIIAELEQQSRGAYTGSMGYINLDGSMDLNILIRSMVFQQFVVDDGYKQKLSFRAGAGLVFDSIANKELQETRAKAKGLLKVFQDKH